MVFRGLSFRFSTENDAQYEVIGQLWDDFAACFGRENLRGLGYNWTPAAIEYGMGFNEEYCRTHNSELTLEELPDELRENYGRAVYKEILLPDEGWTSYSDRTENLSKLYDDIYSEGVLSYEIEAFDDSGNCEISITRQWPSLQTVSIAELDDVFALYKSVIGTPFCVWNENYPAIDITEKDILDDAIRVIRNDKGEIIAAIVRDQDEEVDQLDCWSSELRPGAELARLVVRSDYQNQGMARVLIRQAENWLQNQGYKSVHFLVAKKNEKAIRSYSILGYENVGETYMFENEYFCFEKELV